MSDLFEVKEIDRSFYKSRLQDFLPEEMFDIHTHVWRKELIDRDVQSAARVASWPRRVADENPVEDLLRSYQLMFPDKNVTPLIFSTVPSHDNIDAANDYAASCAAAHNLPSLLFAKPQWSASEFESKLTAREYVGAKVYLSLAADYLSAEEVRIFDFLPPHQLDVLNKHGMIAMLHIPRSGRLGDPVNLAQMLEIERNWPQVKLIIAHVGRAYCESDAGNAFEVLEHTENMRFDISANSNDRIFERLIRTVGPKRILFGSDLPILRMRARRICENGKYINIVPQGLYGDVSQDPHMREVSGEEAERISFFMYEEIDAFRKASERTGLTESDVRDVFLNNAQNLIPTHATG